MAGEKCDIVLLFLGVLEMHTFAYMPTSFVIPCFKGAWLSESDGDTWQ